MPRNDNQKNMEKPVKKACVFCNSTDDNELKFGKIYEHNGLVTHYYCLLLSSNMEQKGEDEDGILGFLAEDILKELKRGKRLACVYCKKIGATLGCCNTKCKRIFHYPCGLKSGSLHQFFGEFRSYCVNHRPRSKPEERFRASLANDLVSTPENSTCFICLDAVNRADRFQTLWAPCCKKNAWFHRDCVQQLAMSAGYFFKCPLCNNKKEFQKAMLDRGIFIPCQDASWELVPNAFEELLYRHNRCDAKVCQCPKGRSYSNSNAKWELILCRTCGSQGIHVSCGKLKWLNPVWDCSECSSILHGSNDEEEEEDNETQTEHSSNSNHSMDSTSSNSIYLTNVNAKDVSDDGSESDISVGVEEPVVFPFESPTKLRPGPRSFKMKQQEIISRNTSFSSEGCSSDFIGPRPETSDTSDSEESAQEEKSRKIIEDIILLDSEDESEIRKTIQLTTNDSLLSIKKTSGLIDNTLLAGNNNSIKSSGSLGTIPVVVQAEELSESEDVDVCGDPETTEPGFSLRDPINIENEPSPEISELTTLVDKVDENIPESSDTLLSVEHPTEFSLVENLEPLPAVLRVVSAVEENDVPLMNIVISNVTSVPPEVFDWGPKTLADTPTPTGPENEKDCEKHDQSKDQEEPRRIYSPITEDITQDINPTVGEIPSIVGGEIVENSSLSIVAVNQAISSQSSTSVPSQVNDKSKDEKNKTQTKIIESIDIEDDDEIIDVEAIDEEPKTTQVVPGVIQNISSKSKRKIQSNNKPETRQDNPKVKDVDNEITNNNSSLKRKLAEEEKILPGSSVEDVPPTDTIKTKKRKTNYPSYIHPTRYNSSSNYRNGVSLENAAVVNVMGNDFVLPLDVNEASSASSSSNSSNYDGDAGTLSDAETGRTTSRGRGVSRLGDNCQLPGESNGCIESNDVSPTTTTTTTTSSPGTDSRTAGLMKEKVMLKNLKFQVGPENDLKVIVSDTYTIKINLENVIKEEKHSRCSDESSLARDGTSPFMKSSGPGFQVNIPPPCSLNSTDKYQECKYENDENRAPRAVTAENNLNLGQKSKRLRDSSNNSTNSDDCSYPIPSKKQETIVQKIIQKSKKSDCNNYKPSNNKFQFKVSIELSKISSFVELNPQIFQKNYKYLQKKKSLIRCKSMSNLLLNEHTPKNPLRRTKSLDSISSINIVNSSRSSNSRSINSTEAQRRRKRKKIPSFEKHDCVR